MDETCSESEVSLSPSQILERLQVLRQLQLLQRGKLQKQHLQFKESSETSSSITEIVSHFSNSTSYNTFRSLLQSTNDISNECSPRLNTSELSQRVQDRDLIDGISVLNLSQESEFIVNTPISSRSKASTLSQIENLKELSAPNSNHINVTSKLSLPLPKKEILLDEIPIMSPKQDFETLLKEKLQNDNTAQSKPHIQGSKKPFLKRGEGMSRFGLRKDQLVIQNTKSLPWKRKGSLNKPNQSSHSLKQHKSQDLTENEPSTLIVPEIKMSSQNKQNLSKKQENIKESSELINPKNRNSVHIEDKKSLVARDVPNELDSRSSSERLDNKTVYSAGSNVHSDNNISQKAIFQKNKIKHPILANKAKTWAAVFTKEQDEFLKQLKQSDYYKNFTSPAKSVVSDTSCDENMSRLRQEREMAEQNMFDLLENKVTHESFNIENSFFNRFLRSNLEHSGESTPLVLQKCLALNPNMMHIYPDIKGRNVKSPCGSESCCSDYTDCCSDAGSSISCCSCKTIEENNKKTKEVNTKKVEKPKILPKTDKEDEDKSHNDTITENDTLKASMAQMNEKLIATSELMKERLHELEDEIETFRKENTHLTALREELDQERHKFYEEKALFEQKLNEEKVLSEYYLAEEKDKLSKQKQMYDRYVKEMRGRLNKKDKDEVIHLKKEINDLKEEIRLKDAKSTSTIARLRNQIKILEKEKKDLHDEVEKLKKQNRRIQHSNEVTRRLTNIKYLEEINKKLTNMTAKETRSEVGLDCDAKYKAYEIERQSRSRRMEPAKRTVPRPRAKSVPNLNVTSRYAKYFSQRDTASQREENKTVERVNIEQHIDDISLNSESLNDVDSEHDEDDNLEKLYMEKFRTASPTVSNNRSGSISERLSDKLDLNDNAKSFFITKPRNSKSPKESISPYQNTSGSSLNRSNSPISILSNKSNSRKSPSFSIDNVSNFNSRSRSPASYVSRSSNQMTTVIHNDTYREKLAVLSPEPVSSKPGSSRTGLKTNLNPVEIKNADGSRELRFPNGNIKYLSADGKYCKFVYYNGDVKENFYDEGRIKYFYAETKTYHTTHADGLEVLEFPDGQVEKRYKDGSSEIRLPNGSVRYYDPKNEHVREEWRFPDGAALTVAANGEQRIVFTNGQVEVHAKDHKRREFPDGTVKLVYNDGTIETRYASGRVRIKDKHGNLIMDSTSR